MAQIAGIAAAEINGSVGCFWNHTPRGPLPHREGLPHLMMVYQEKIPPPLALPTDAQETKLIAESLANDDRWVKHLIDALAGILREKH
jgi:hypothetical protein